MVIEIDGHRFAAVLEKGKSPESCTAFSRLLPFESQVVHVRWSGEAMWIPLGNADFGVGYEDATSYPAPGQLLLHPKGKSEAEILIAYGSVHFASKAGLPSIPTAPYVRQIQRIQLKVALAWVIRALGLPPLDGVVSISDIV